MILDTNFEVLWQVKKCYQTISKNSQITFQTRLKILPVLKREPNLSCQSILNSNFKMEIIIKWFRIWNGYSNYLSILGTVLISQNFVVKKKAWIQKLRKDSIGIRIPLFLELWDYYVMCSKIIGIVGGVVVKWLLGK